MQHAVCSHSVDWFSIYKQQVCVQEHSANMLGEGLSGSGPVANHGMSFCGQSAVTVIYMQHAQK